MYCNQPETFKKTTKVSYKNLKVISSDIFDVYMLNFFSPKFEETTILPLEVTLQTTSDDILLWRCGIEF